MSAEPRKPAGYCRNWVEEVCVEAWLNNYDPVALERCGRDGEDCFEVDGDNSGLQEYQPGDHVDGAFVSADERHPARPICGGQSESEIAGEDPPSRPSFNEGEARRVRGAQGAQHDTERVHASSAAGGREHDGRHPSTHILAGRWSADRAIPADGAAPCPASLQSALDLWDWGVIQRRNPRTGEIKLCLHGNPSSAGTERGTVRGEPSKSGTERGTMARGTPMARGEEAVLGASAPGDEVVLGASARGDEVAPIDPLAGIPTPTRTEFPHETVLGASEWGIEAAPTACSSGAVTDLTRFDTCAAEQASGHVGGATTRAGPVKPAWMSLAARTGLAAPAAPPLCDSPTQACQSPGPLAARSCVIDVDTDKVDVAMNAMDEVSSANHTTMVGSQCDIPSSKHCITMQLPRYEAVPGSTQGGMKLVPTSGPGTSLPTCVLPGRQQAGLTQAGSPQVGRPTGQVGTGPPAGLEDGHCDLAPAALKLPAASSGVKTSPIVATDGSYVLVSSGKLYCLRTPHGDYLKAVAAAGERWDDADPTIGWGFPRLTPALLRSQPCLGVQGASCAVLKARGGKRGGEKIKAVQGQGRERGKGAGGGATSRVHRGLGEVHTRAASHGAAIRSDAVYQGAELGAGGTALGRHAAYSHPGSARRGSSEDVYEEDLAVWARADQCRVERGGGDGCVRDNKVRSEAPVLRDNMAIRAYTPQRSPMVSISCQEAGSGGRPPAGSPPRLGDNYDVMPVAEVARVPICGSAKDADTAGGQGRSQGACPRSVPIAEYAGASSSRSFSARRAELGARLLELKGRIATLSSWGNVLRPGAAADQGGADDSSGLKQVDGGGREGGAGGTHGDALVSGDASCTDVAVASGAVNGGGAELVGRIGDHGRQLGLDGQLLEMDDGTREAIAANGRARAADMDSDHLGLPIQEVMEERTALAASHPPSESPTKPPVVVYRDRAAERRALHPFDASIRSANIVLEDDMMLRSGVSRHAGGQGEPSTQPSGQVSAYASRIGRDRRASRLLQGTGSSGQVAVGDRGLLTVGPSRDAGPCLLSENVGFKILAAMGWTPGTGIGAHRQGQTDPVVAHGCSHADKRGIGWSP